MIRLRFVVLAIPVAAAFAGCLTYFVMPLAPRINAAQWFCPWIFNCSSIAKMRASSCSVSMARRWVSTTAATAAASSVEVVPAAIAATTAASAPDTPAGEFAGGNGSAAGRPLRVRRLLRLDLVVGRRGRTVRADAGARQRGAAPVMPAAAIPQSVRGIQSSCQSLNFIGRFPPRRRRNLRKRIGLRRHNDC
jgi:hypothetical protein